MKDQIVEQVIQKYEGRSSVGIKKYGTTLEKNNTDNYLIHLQQELMDATLYIEKKMTLDKQIIDPLLKRNESLLFSSAATFNHEGKLSYMNLTLVTMFRAVSCFVAIQSTFLSLWKVINHKEYPAANVDIPSCLDLSTIEYGLSFQSFNTLSWKGNKLKWGFQLCPNN